MVDRHVHGRSYLRIAADDDALISSAGGLCSTKLAGVSESRLGLHGCGDAAVSHARHLTLGAFPEMSGHDQSRRLLVFFVNPILIATSFHRRWQDWQG